MSNSDKYINNLNSDAFLRASTINTRLSLLSRELNNNIDNLVFNQKTLGDVFKKHDANKETIYSSNTYKINLGNLMSNDISFDDILLEENKKTIIVKGEDDKDKPKVIKEEKKETKVIKKKGEQNNLFDDIVKEIDDKKIKVQKTDEKTIFDKICEGDCLNEDNNNENDNKKEPPNFMRASTIFHDIFDFNQSVKINNGNINENQNKIQNKKQDNNKNNSDTVRFSKIFKSLTSDKSIRKKDEKIPEKINENEEDEKKLMEIEEEEKDKKKDVLKEEYYPIDVIEEAEKYYNLSKESKEDLYPLNTYKMNNDLFIEFITHKEIKIDSQIIGSITTIGMDEKNTIYLCTKNGKIIKKEEKKEEITICYEKYNESITCIDIFENIIVTGDETGKILIWTNNGINQTLTNLNNNNKILLVKIIEVQNSKIILIFSDILGSLYLIVANKNKIGDYSKTILMQKEEMPIYNIITIPNKKSDIGKEKDNVLIALASNQICGLYQINIKENKMIKLTEVKYIYGEKGKYQFDISVGYGFPPVSDLKSDLNNAARRGSISEDIATDEQEDENYHMVAVSYGNVILLYGVRIIENNKISFKDIGYFITEKPILRMMFVSNSMLALINENFNIKLVNTYDFVPRKFITSESIKPTNKCLIFYELFNVSNLGISGQEFDKNTNNNVSKKYYYTNKILATNNGLILIGKDSNKYHDFSLLNYYDVIFHLCDKEDYIKMLWLSLIIFNKKSNILNKQLNKLEGGQKATKSKCNTYLMAFFLKKVMTELTKNNEIYVRMFLEFCMETDYFDVLPRCIQLLGDSGLDKYIYINLTKYMINGDLYEYVIDSDFLSQYISYYIKQNDKLLLNKVLLKLNLDTLLQPQILKIILENELINPYIYTRIKNIQAGKIDYFLPAEYLDTVFKQDNIKERYELEKQDEEKIKRTLSPEQLKIYEEQLKAKKEEMEKELNAKREIEKDYKKLIIEHNMDFFNEKTFSCHGYLGHKFLWYCNKCLSGKEYPNDGQMAPNNYRETAIKILAYLLIKENIKLYLDFDSYTYLKIISKFFIEPQLSRLIFKEEDCSNKQQFTESEREVIDKYLGKKRSESFNGDYIYRAINKVIETMPNNYYAKYDFYLMTCEICSKKSDFYFDKKKIMEVLKFFIDFNLQDFLDKQDTYNCHRKLKTEKEKEKYYKKNEENIMILLKYLKEHNCLQVNDDIEEINEKGEIKAIEKNDDVSKLLESKKIKNYKSVYFFLCEQAKNYDDCFKMKIDEYEKNPDLFNINIEKKRQLFRWISETIEYTYKLDMLNDKFYNSKEMKNKIVKKYHPKIKKILLSYLVILCEISIDELSNITDLWFFEENEQIDLIQHLGGGASNALQLKYIDHLLLSKQKDIIDNIEKYLIFLELEIDILIKDRNRKKIKELLTEYKILCNDSIFNKLSSNRINDCGIYICQIQGRIAKGVDLALIEVEEKFENILKVLEKPNYNPILIDIELNEMYNYFEMGLSVCENNFFEQEKENEKIDDNWLKLFNKACQFKTIFYPKYEENKNNFKTKDYKKIFLNLQTCIQLILEKMSDYITLVLLVEIIAKNIGEGKHGKIIEFYTFLDKSIYAFRRTETILFSCKSLMSTSILISYNDLGFLKTKGKYLCENKCNFCGLPIKDEFSSFLLFECGHKYHLNCCSKEDDEKICFACKKEEVGAEIDEIDLKVRENECENKNRYDNEIKQYENKQKDEKEEKRRKKFLRNTRLNHLKKLRKKRREINDVISGKVAYSMN